jgi:hypothetical protein
VTPEKAFVGEKKGKFHDFLRKKNMSGINSIINVRFLFTIILVSVTARGQSDPNYVTQEQYNNLKQEFETIKGQLADLNKTKKQEQEKTENLENVLRNAMKLADESKLGNTKLLIAGDAAAGYVDEDHAPSTFTAEFNPMLLWQLNDRFFFEGGLELGLEGPDEDGEGSQTDVELDSAYLVYILNDYALVGAGKFTTPFTAYHRHFDPSWINKLPFDPLIYSDSGIAPDSSVGAFITGALPVKKSIMNYAAYLTNGPALITDDPDAAGSLNFDSYNDLNNNKAFGFRLGYLPVHELEIGYSFEYSKPDKGNLQNLHSYLHGIDLNYVKDNDYLQGRITARFGWIWSQLDNATYPAVSPSRFNNDRNGGYVEIAYRPTKAFEDWVNNLELAFCYDRLNISSRVPGGGNEYRWIPGINYWITPRTVLKTAYAFDEKVNGEDNSIFAIQFATGFKKGDYNENL